MRTLFFSKASRGFSLNLEVGELYAINRRHAEREEWDDPLSFTILSITTFTTTEVQVFNSCIQKKKKKIKSKGNSEVGELNIS
jgi:hypothetical protein